MSIQKIIKFSFISLAILFSLVIGAMLIIPSLYKSEIFELVKEEAEKNIDATVDIEDLNISFFRNFPKPSIELTGLKIGGKNSFEGLSLISIDEALAQIDLRALLNYEEGISIRKIALENASFNIRVLKDGTANYDIVPMTETEASQESESAGMSTLNFELEELELKNINLSYQDEAGAISTTIKGLHTDGYINIDEEGYLFKSTSNIDQMDMVFEGVKYLDKASIKARINCLADLDNMKFTLMENQLFLNALELKSDGFVQLQEDIMDMDLRFEAPGNEFKEIFSLIPSAYISGYESVQFDGLFELNGAFKGRMEGESYPALTMDLKVNNGFFQYPELPFPVENINLSINIDKEEGDLDKLVLGIPTFSMRLQEQDFGGDFLLKTPLSNPDLDMELKGILDLNSLAKAFPLEDINSLQGVLTTNVNFKGNYKQFEEERYQDMNVKGTIALDDFSSQAYSYPVVQIKQLKANFAPELVELEDFNCMLGKSDLSGNARIENLLAYFNPDQTLRGQLNLNSENLSMDEWLVETEETTTEDNAEETETIDSEAMTGLPFDRFDFILSAHFKNISYDAYQLKNLKTKGHLNAKSLRADEFSMEIEDSDISFKGRLDNIFGFILNEELLQGKLSLQANKLNLNPFLVSSETEGSSEKEQDNAEESYELVIIPKNIDLDINADAGQILYEEITLENFEGKMNIRAGRVILENCLANSMGGSILISGAYDCNDPQDPGFNFKFELEEVDFSQAFNSLNTLQQLAPIGQYVNGTFNSSLVMDGKMGQDMMPLINQLNAQGFLHTLEGEIQEFEPLSALDQKLNLNVFNGISIKDTKNWFEIKDGKVEVQEFDLKHKDIAMKISGTHSIEQDMDYLIKMNIPKEVYDKGLSGNLVDGAYSLINQQASKLGLKVDKAESFNINMTLGGNIKEPKVGMKLVGSSGEDSGLKEEIASTVESEKEALKEELAEEIDNIKESVKEEADSTLMALKDKAKEEADKKKEELKAETDRILQEKLEKARLDSIAKDKAKKAEEALKKKLDEFNPLKKRKKKKKDN